MAKPAVIGIDLGSSDSYVGYVGKNIVDIVQNEVSQRRTPTLVGFTNQERLLGDAALAAIKLNSKNTCRNFKHLLGRKLENVQDEESFWSTCPLATAADGFAGYEVTYKAELQTFSAPQILAMYLTKLREITEKWCQAKVADAVIGVPASFSDVHRQAVLDAAKIAGIPVLSLMNEHTAVALAYGIYRSNDFDKEKPLTVAFCSVGHTIFSVFIVQFVRGSLRVICERSAKVGGRNMDECLMREFAAQFKKKVGCDPLSSKKPAFKLEDAVTKTKKILSANSEANLNCECLMEDEDFASHISRADFQKMCEPMMDKVKEVLEAVKAASAAAGVGIDLIDSVEIVGGASRVPWVKDLCSQAFGGKKISTTLNADECVARGCALQAAILSPLYKVRDFKIEDMSPYAISVGWQGSGVQPEAANKDKSMEDGDGDVEMAAAEGEMKTSVVFPANATLNVSKVLSFWRKSAFELKAQYAIPESLAPGTDTSLGTFKIDVPAQSEPKKVKVRAKLTMSGMFNVESAHLVEEEEYEETVKEKRELHGEADDEEMADGDEADQAASKEEQAPAENAKDAEEAAAEKTKDAEEPKAEEAAKTDGNDKTKAAAAPAEETAENAKAPAADAKAPAADSGDAEMSGKQEDAAAKDEAQEATAPEKKEEPETSAAPDAEEGAEGNSNGNADPETEEAPKRKAKRPRYEWVDVVKKKRRLRKTELTVTASGRPGLSDEIVQQRMDEETAMQTEMREIIETQERRNDLESYILSMRSQISETGECGKFISDADREKFSAELQKAEDWLYDTYDATKLMYIDKLEELKKTGDHVVWRRKEDSMRKDWIDALAGTIVNYRKAAAEPEETYGHIAAEKLAKIIKDCDDTKKWLSDLQAKQDALPKYEKPVLLCRDMEKRNLALSEMADEILKEPKPAPKPPPEPPKEEDKKEEKKDEDSKGEADEDGKPTNTGENPETDAKDSAKMDVD